MEKIQEHLDDIQLDFDTKFIDRLQLISLDWEKFLEINADNTDDILFEQVTQLLDLSEINNIIDILLVMVKKVYMMPAKDHIKCMIKQFYIYEPVSLSMLSLFTSLKIHFEYLVTLYIKTRNSYIKNKNLNIETLNLDKKIKEWEDINILNKLESSSIILKFFNGEFGVNLDAEGLDESKVLKLKNFKYLGFCTKQPHKRLIALLNFPLDEIVSLIKQMDDTKIFPSYKKIYSHITKILEEVKHPEVEDKYIRKTEPNISGKELVLWYVTEILELRKSLKHEGESYNKYYIECAKNIEAVTKIIKKDLSQFAL